MSNVNEIHSWAVSQNGQTETILEKLVTRNRTRELLIHCPYRKLFGHSDRQIIFIHENITKLDLCKMQDDLKNMASRESRHEA